MRKNKIRILHVAQAAGGVDRYIRMLLKYLDKEKFENILVCSQDFHEEDYRGLADSFEQVEMTRAIGGNDLKAIREVRALIGVMLALIAVTPIIFKVLVKGDYGTAFFQVPILYFGIFFNSLVNFYSGIYIALKRTKQVGYSSVAGAAINALINIFLIGKIGLYAASISTAVSFLVIAVYRAVVFSCFPPFL